MTEEKPLYRLFVLGGKYVGTSALTNRFIHGGFVDNYDPSLNDSFIIERSIDSKPTKLEIYDLIHHEKQGGFPASGLVETLMRDYQGFLLVYSITSRESFEEVIEIHEQIKKCKTNKNSNDNIMSIVLVGHMCDLENKREVDKSEGEKLASEWNASFFEASALKNINVEECFYELARLTIKYCLPVDESSSQSQKCCKCIIL